jgi:hypothetical protein
MPSADPDGSSVTDADGAFAQALRAPAVEENRQSQDWIGALWSAHVGGHRHALEVQHYYRFGELVSLLVRRLLADLIPPGYQTVHHASTRNRLCLGIYLLLGLPLYVRNIQMLVACRIVWRVAPRLSASGSYTLGRIVAKPRRCFFPATPVKSPFGKLLTIIGA